MSEKNKRKDGLAERIESLRGNSGIGLEALNF